MSDEPGDVITDGAEPVQEPQEPEQTAEEAAPETTEGEGQAEVEEVVEESEIKSERGKNRVQQLANERNQLAQENKSLRESMTEEPKADSQQMPPWMQQQSGFGDLAGKELTPQEYEQHLAARAEQIADLRIQSLERKMEFQRNVENDITYLEKSYPELAGEIDDPILNEAITKARDNFKKAAAVDPTVRFRDFLEPTMKVRRGGEQAGRSQASSKLAEQSAQSAPRSEKPSKSEGNSEEKLIEMMQKGEISAKEAEALISQLSG